MDEKCSFLDFYESTTSTKLTESSFHSDLLDSTKKLFFQDEQDFIIIWGDKNKNQDNKNAQEGLETRYPFLKNRIFQYVTSKEFRFKSMEFRKKNILFLMSGTFANEIFEEKENILWVNNMIREQSIHSKSIILFTSKSTVLKNNWTMESLQQKYKYITQLTIEYSSLFESFDNMIYNRIHRSFDQIKNLDLFFRSETHKVLEYFIKPDSLNLSQLRPQQTNLKKSLLYLQKYIKESKVKSPLTLYFSDKDVDTFYNNFDLCFDKNGANSKNEEESQKKIIENIINLYTKEGNCYKILNYTLNTMNPTIYEYMNTIYKLFSKCLYEFEDKKSENQIELYRGAAVQKYQYETLYQEYLYNSKKGKSTFIIFPQFLSTSIKPLIAQQIAGLRLKEVVVENNQRISNIKQFSKENEDYLKSQEFKDSYKVLFTINAEITLGNKFRPKYLKYISDYKNEEEYLFQPYQPFRVTFMDKGDNKEGSEVKMSLSYTI